MVGPRIEADWKINKVLKEYPQLLEVIADSHPTLAKLRNPILRKVQSKLVTVEQAAGIAGLDSNQLLNRMNTAVGHEQAEHVEASPQAPAEEKPGWVNATTDTQELDVRPILERGEEPFGVITEAARGIAVGETLELRTTFDPIPLRGVSERQGFEAYTSGAGNDWTTLFYRVREARGTKKPTPVTPSGAPITVEVTIDVSELVPPEPMMKILAALNELPDGGQLTVHHVRRPMHLYPRLDELGYSHETTEIALDKVQLLIKKPVHPQ